MIYGTVIFANRNWEISNDTERMIGSMYPQIHVEKTTRGNDVLLMQSFIRADVILLDVNLVDVALGHLIQELKRDIVQPYIIVSQSSDNELIRQRVLRMGADLCVVLPEEVMNVCAFIQMQLRERAPLNEYSILAEKKLQRVFMDYGIPCSIKGYGFLKIALKMVSGNRAQILGSMNRLYERIGAQQGCSAGCVERNIRYAIDKCWSRSRYADSPRPGNGEFLVQLLEACRTEKTSLPEPKISVYCEKRRVFK